MTVLGTLLASAVALGQQSNRIYLPLLAGGEGTSASPTTAPGEENPIRSGRATYYDANGDGNCMFGPSPGDLMVAAISHEDYGNPDPDAGPAAVYCGAYVEVTGELGTVVVRIVDKCPDALCESGHLDMSPQAFEKVAPIHKGIVPITWRVISPELGRPVAYHIKPGSNQWWTAIQVRHHRNPIVRLEYRNAEGAWVEMQRQDYNYFVGQSMGVGPYTLRVTDSYGNTLIDSGIPLAENGETSGAAQFPPGP
jgi:expansin (peptidoglycan-binding protein)